MVEVAEALVEQEAALLEEGASVRESLVTRVSVKDLGGSVFWLLQENMSSSVMVRVHNFLKVPLQAVRTSTAAGEVGDAVVDCPTQLICTWIFICCSMIKLKEHSREIC